MSITITIDGVECTCEKGEYIAAIAARNGIEIPLLCGTNEALLGRGCCRVCVVELVENGRTKVVTSCIYPVVRECEVLTNTERIIRERGVIFALLASLAPDSKEIAKLAKEHAAPSAVKLEPLPEGGKCVLCGLCAEACKSLGTGAISTVGRGIGKKISTPFDETSPDCIGCMSCVQVCPTNSIPVQMSKGVRTIWGQDFALAHCDVCGVELDTQAAVAFEAQRLAQLNALDDSDEASDLTLCPLCKKALMSEAFVYSTKH